MGSILTVSLSTLPNANSSDLPPNFRTKRWLGPGPDVKTQNSNPLLRKSDKYSANMQLLMQTKP